ncbi:MAG: hypothetical protein SVX43_21545, partial [Cyanobacteriota bacterium]|nr:hypothetical protein [Cyanobacteriota bacterium]
MYFRTSKICAIALLARVSGDRNCTASRFHTIEFRDGEADGGLFFLERSFTTAEFQANFGNRRALIS